MTISVIVPVRNAAPYIARCVSALLAQDYPSDRFEIVVMDGRSSDGTRAAVEAVARRDARVRLHDNPGGIVSSGIDGLRYPFRTHIGDVRAAGANFADFFLINFEAGGLESGAGELSRERKPYIAKPDDADARAFIPN